MRKLLLLLPLLLTACSWTKPPTCDGFNKRPINASQAQAEAEPQASVQGLEQFSGQR